MAFVYRRNPSVPFVGRPPHEQTTSGPRDAEYVLRRTHGVVGFLGASSIERLPTEVAITDCLRRFKQIAARAAG